MNDIVMLDRAETPEWVRAFLKTRRQEDAEFRRKNAAFNFHPETESGAYLVKNARRRNWIEPPDRSGQVSYRLRVAGPVPQKCLATMDYDALASRAFVQFTDVDAQAGVELGSWVWAYQTFGAIMDAHHERAFCLALARGEPQTLLPVAEGQPYPRWAPKESAIV